MTFLGDRDGDGTGRDGRTDKRTDGHMDRQTFLGKYYFRFNKHLNKLLSVSLSKKYHNDEAADWLKSNVLNTY